MDITPEIVKKVAENARLKLKEEEIKKFAQEMKDILSNFEKLNEVDTKDVPPSFHPVPIKNTSRPDEKGECLTTQEALSLSPHTSGNYFKGPKIL
ncbi:Asp-tRNA(Asn)/Glu-tRNA(Gln) amidotransferase subunit GatC [Candidatus Woesearchaeota archaeon]|nr:Asp-tRNA(Asn)/Glu-tRNA(Gln) amidotransferase subunit GatC [Candidatus Woesearchaeota archaeon]